MTTNHDILHALTQLAPIELAMGFDNVGLLVGSPGDTIDSVLIALDITDRVVEEAIACGCRLIVSHHPLFFDLPKQLNPSAPGPVGRALRLVREGVSAICMHTNLDVAIGGVNDLLLNKLGLSPEPVILPQPLYRIGQLHAGSDLAGFALHVKQTLGCAQLRYADAGRRVSRVMVVGGSGGDHVEQAAQAGCDTLVTGDVKHAQFQEAASQRVNLIDAGHYETERPICAAMARQLAHLPIRVHLSETVEHTIINTL